MLRVILSYCNYRIHSLTLCLNQSHKAHDISYRKHIINKRSLILLLLENSNRRNRFHTFLYLKSLNMNYTTVNFCVDAKQLNMPFILVGISAQRSIVMLVDTGSENNQIFRYLYQEVPELFTKTDQKALIQGSVGSEETCIVNGNLYISGKEYLTDFLIMNSEAGYSLSEMKGLPVGGLIGTKFMLEHGWIIDYSKQRILIPES